MAGEVQTDASGTKTVWAILEDGRRFEGDILIGADGIWSKVLLPPEFSSFGTFLQNDRHLVVI